MFRAVNFLRASSVFRAACYQQRPLFAATVRARSEDMKVFTSSLRTFSVDSSANILNNANGNANIDTNTNPDASVDTSLSIDNFALSAGIKNTLTSAYGIRNLFPVQAKVFEPVRQGQDLVVRSRTGSGKTLAFLLPLMERLLASGKKPSRGGCTVLILEPTRELARQVWTEIRKFPQFSCALIHGGASYNEQRSSVRDGVDFLVGNTGRLTDVSGLKNDAQTNRPFVSFKDTEFVVLDESDEMLRMGFVEDVERILSSIHSTNKQVLLFSATMPDWVHDVARKYQRNPRFINLVDNMKTAQNVTHYAVCTPSYSEADVASVLRDVLVQFRPKGRIMLFSQTKRMADTLTRIPALAPWRPQALHGDRSQEDRDRVMNGFRRGAFNLLAATDVAAHGLDIPDVDLVVTVPFPLTVEHYIHRSGRTGRAGRDGKSVVFYTPEERTQLPHLEDEIGAPIVPFFFQAQKPLSLKEQVLSLTDNSEIKDTRPLMPVAEELIKLGPEYLAKLMAIAMASSTAAVASVGDPRAVNRSLLTSETGFATVLIRQANISKSTAISLISRLCGIPVTGFGSDFSFTGGMLLDVPFTYVGVLMELAQKEEYKNIVSFPASLPAECFAKARHSSLEHRSQSGGRSGGGGGGGRGRFSRNNSFSSSSSSSRPWLNQRFGSENRSSSYAFRDQPRDNYAPSYSSSSSSSSSPADYDFSVLRQSLVNGNNRGGDRRSSYNNDNQSQVPFAFEERGGNNNNKSEDDWLSFDYSKKH
eukprot:TRINITY_DN2735_c0_g1_i1.p1 TRINITY_DN2735_c0_g1~~TRINITY_DN2735_c0_g1_i1.p1  ORF type:complete len:759 (+),score=188.23 TRINITY_DN2735_c0_g1_i1:68-2344(+)